jgi:Tol biopolymer transport system component/DNA-binding winged helix-turn-helix (wHTH) protein
MAVECLSGRDFWIGDWLIRPSLAKIERGPDSVHVTPRSMAVLVYLAEARGRVVSRNDVLDGVWPRMAVTQDALSQCVVELRKAFGDDPRHPTVIETIPKIGIRLIAPVAFAETQALAGHEPTGVSEADESAQPTATEEPATFVWQPTAARALRVVTSRSVVAIVLLTAALGSAAFWFSEQSKSSWRDPLAGADFKPVTDFIGAEEQAAISPDGRFVAFLSDRDGTWDVWVGQIGTGDFRNLTKGTVPQLWNPAVRMLGFSPSGTDVLFWAKTTNSAGDAVDYGWMVPVVGGDLRRDSSGISELDWSPDGERIVYHPSAAGDPMFVTGAGERAGGRRIHVAPPGIHCHFPLWSHDGQTIYFVRGFVPDEMDVWRIRASGGEPERLTFHNSRVSFPTWLDARTLLYLATDADGSGPWLHALDLKSLRTHRVNTGGREYTSISASGDGRRLVATEAHPTADLWRISLRDKAPAADATKISLRAPRAVSPRIGRDFIVFRAPKAGTDALWKLDDGTAREVWSGADGRVVAGPALSPEGDRLAFAVRRRARTQLFVINADGSGARRIAEEFDLRGAPAWSPDGAWIAFSAMKGGQPRLFKVSTAGSGPPIPLSDEYALDPAWSPSGRFLVYSGPDVGTAFRVKAVSAEGAPHALPELFLVRGSRRLDFLGDDEDSLVVLKGTMAEKQFWVVDLRSGDEHPLTDLGPGSNITDFDVSADGREIVFDRVRDESDIVRIDLADG